MTPVPFTRLPTHAVTAERKLSRMAVEQETDLVAPFTRGPIATREI